MSEAPGVFYRFVGCEKAQGHLSDARYGFTGLVAFGTSADSSTLGMILSSHHLPSFSLAVRALRADASICQRSHAR